MKFEKSIRFDIEWDEVDVSHLSDKQQIELQEILFENGFERALSIYKEGYKSGELVEERDDVTYYGWWYLNNGN